MIKLSKVLKKTKLKNNSFLNTCKNSKTVKHYLLFKAFENQKTSSNMFIEEVDRNPNELLDTIKNNINKNISETSNNVVKKVNNLVKNNLDLLEQTNDLYGDFNNKKMKLIKGINENDQ